MNKSSAQVHHGLGAKSRECTVRALKGRPTGLPSYARFEFRMPRIQNATAPVFGWLTDRRDADQRELGTAFVAGHRLE